MLRPWSPWRGLCCGLSEPWLLPVPPSRVRAPAVAVVLWLSSGCCPTQRCLVSSTLAAWPSLTACHGQWLFELSTLALSPVAGQLYFLRRRAVASSVHCHPPSWNCPHLPGPGLLCRGSSGWEAGLASAWTKLCPALGTCRLAGPVGTCCCVCLPRRELELLARGRPCPRGA